MSKSWWVLTIMLSSVTCFSQDTADVTRVTKLTFLNPGISREMRVVKLQTVYVQAFMNTSAYFSYSSSFGTEAGIYFDPALTGQYRYYYNAKRRAEKGKRTEMNSMNYLAGVWETDFTKAGVLDDNIDEEKRRAVNKLGVVWGLQRNGSKHFSLDLSLGFGYVFAKGTGIDENGNKFSSPVSQVTSIGQINLGFWLNRGK